MTKRKGKAKRQPSWIQTRRSPKNKHNVESAQEFAQRMLNRAFYFKHKNMGE